MRGTQNKRALLALAAEWDATISETGVTPNRILRTERAHHLDTAEWYEVTDHLVYRSPRRHPVSEIVILFASDLGIDPNICQIREWLKEKTT